MSTTPTPAETPTKVVRYDIESMDTTEPPQHVVVEHDEGEYVSWSDYATAQAELTTLREKLAEEQAGAASMRATFDRITNIQENGFCKGGWLDIANAVYTALSTTTGKATLEELERLRAEVVELKGELHTRFEKGVIAGTASVLEGVETKGIRDVLAERDTALATIAELRARVTLLEGALRRNIAQAHGAMDGARLAGGGAVKHIESWAELKQESEQVLQPTAPTEPEKAGSVAPTKEGRERFERWCATRGHKPGVWREHVWRYDNNEVHEMWLAWQASQLEPQPATVPLALAEGENS